MALKYNTRGNAAPNDKTRVFLYCHPNDITLYFDDVCRDILDQIDCAVYYAENGQINPEEMRFELLQMNLIVVAVSAEVLCSDDSIVILLRLASENGIPVLPLLQESGLEPFYANVFGNLQYLDKHQIDETALPYKEKLSNYLNAVLISDELSKKIRAAFDAYIFLSYRKKDRVYAQKLMKLIHQNEFARDIAIWYDEFITPGEDFSELIAQALHKSSLFVLTVTPNLVNELNYVMNVEYPMAVETGKIIAPVEMVKTDAEDLKQKYKDIPETVSGDNPSEVAALLKNRLSAISRSESDDPHHLFFIGLAYLSGIDVEKDPARALELIGRAADAGLEEAAEKLIDMYYYGDGVTRDPEEAVRHMAMLTDKYVSIAEKSRKEADLDVMLRYRMRYGALALDAALYEKARSAYESAYEEAKALASGSVNRKPLIRMFQRAKKLTGHNMYFSEAFYRMIVCCRSLMEIYTHIGLVENASEWGAKAANPITGAAAELQGDLRINEELIRIYGRIGILCLESGSVQRAEDWFKKEYRLVPEDDSFGARIADIGSLRHYSLLEEEKGNLPLACDYAVTACRRCWNLYQETRNPRLPETVLSLTLRIVTLYEKAKNLNKAEEWMKDIYAVIEEVSKDRRPLYLERTENLAHLRRGSLLMCRNQYEEALQQIEKGMPYFLRLSEETMETEDTKEVLSALELMGDCLSFMHRYEEAAGYYEKAGVFISDTLFFTRTIRDCRLAAVACEKLIEVYLKLGYGVYAAKWYNFAQYYRNAIAQSTRNETDEEALAALRSKKSLTEATSPLPEGVVSLRAALRRRENVGGSSAALEDGIAGVMKEFCETHMQFCARYEILTLAWILSDESADKTNKIIYCDKITKVIMDNYKPFLRYDEQANLIVVYCGFTVLAQAKRIIGGKDAALRDFNSFYKQIPILGYPADSVHHPVLWQLIDSYINGDLQ